MVSAGVFWARVMPMAAPPRPNRQDRHRQPAIRRARAFRVSMIGLAGAFSFFLLRMLSFTCLRLRWTSPLLQEADSPARNWDLGSV